MAPLVSAGMENKDYLPSRHSNSTFPNSHDLFRSIIHPARMSLAACQGTEILWDQAWTCIVIENRRVGFLSFLTLLITEL